jgi:hypothetical protein
MASLAFSKTRAASVAAMYPHPTMVSHRHEPELAEPSETWVHFLLRFDWETKPNALLIGARWLGEFAYIRKSGVYPESRIGWRLPESLFERGGFVELAVKDTGAGDLDFRPWDDIGWTWTGVFNATTRSGKPFLEKVG